MRARWVVVALLMVALAGQSVRAYQRVRSARLVGAIRLQLAAASAGVPGPLARAAGAGLAEARRLDPVAVEPRAFAGDLALLLGRWEEAIAIYRRVAGHELRAETLVNWGIALERSGDHAAAIRQWRRAVALAPRYLEGVVPSAFRDEVRAAPLEPLPDSGARSTRRAR